MRELSVHLFGVPHFAINGEPLSGFDSMKSKALLIYLAMERQHAHRREKLAELFWPGKAEGDARRNLRQALAVLRKVISDRGASIPFLLTTRQDIQFNPACDSWLDSTAFEAAYHRAEAHGHSGPDYCSACREDLQRAADLFTGDFLDQTYLDDSPGFMEWAMVHRERYRRQAIDVFQQLMRIYERESRFSEALAVSRKWAALDHWGEEAHRQLMRLLVLQGHRGEALQHYRDLKQDLAEELGLEPEADTTALFKLIQRGPLKEPVTLPFFLAGNMFAPGYAEPVCVAREKELAVLDRHLAGALAGQGRVVFVTGTAGQGKTTLLRAFVRRTIEANPELLSAAGFCNAYEGLGDPYLPFRDILAMLMADLDLHYAAGRVSRLHAQRIWSAFPYVLETLLVYGRNLVDVFVASKRLYALAALAGMDTSARIGQLRELEQLSQQQLQEFKQSQLLEQFTNVLRRIAAKHPLVLICEDIHWADRASISLLFHLGRRIAGSRILLLCSYRQEEVIGKEGAERHPLEPVMAEFKRRFGDVWLHLDETDANGRRLFVNELVDTESNLLSGAFREKLFHHTRGQPLFTVELLRYLEDNGDLVLDPQAGWVEGPDIQWDFIPARVEGVIEERIGNLGERLRNILNIASVEGEVFTAQVVSAVMGEDEISVLRTLVQELVQGHRLLLEEVIESPAEEERVSRFRFRHLLFQNFLYRRLSGSERQLLHGRAASAIELLRPSDHEALAYHYRKAGDSSKSLEHFKLAGERALRAYALHEAETYFRSALELTADEPLRAELLSGLGAALYYQSRYVEANQAWSEGIAIFRHQGNLDRANWLYARRIRSMSRKGDWRAVMAISREAQTLMQDSDPSEGKAAVMQETARVEFLQGIQEPAVMELAEQAREMAARMGSVRVHADALTTLSMDTNLSVDESLDMLSQVVEIADATMDWGMAARAYNTMGVVYSYAGQMWKGKACFHLSADMFRNTGDIDQVMYAFANKVFVDIHMGDLLQAAEELSLGRRYAEEPAMDSSGIQHLYMAEAYLYMARGDLAMALERYRPLWQASKEHANFQFINEIGAKMGWILLKRGDLEEAGEIFSETLAARGINIYTWFNALQAFMVIKYAREGNLVTAREWLDKVRNTEPVRVHRHLMDTCFNPLAEAHLAAAEGKSDQARDAFERFNRRAGQVQFDWWQVHGLWDQAEFYLQDGEREKGITLLWQALARFKDMNAKGWVESVAEQLGSPASPGCKKEG